MMGGISFLVLKLQCMQIDLLIMLHPCPAPLLIDQCIKQFLLLSQCSKKKGPNPQQLQACMKVVLKEVKHLL
jgi:hypothetical protein